TRGLMLSVPAGCPEWAGESRSCLRLHVRRGRAPDGAGLRGAAPARPQRPDAPRLDYFEIHEFAPQVLATLKAWEDADLCRDRLGRSTPLGPIDRSRLNVTGSSLAAGHPFAATGPRIVAKLAKLLTEKGSGADLDLRAGRPGRNAILER